jgi:hypothetical protein
MLFKGGEQVGQLLGNQPKANIVNLLSEAI